jgi:hypothetical protein
MRRGAIQGSVPSGGGECSTAGYRVRGAVRRARHPAEAGSQDPPLQRYAAPRLLETGGRLRVRARVAVANSDSLWSWPPILVSM